MDTNTNALYILRQGEITIQGEFIWGSNFTFLTQVEHSGVTLPAVYKPSRGERILWDFPATTLAYREVAAYIVSEAIGWDFIPPTVFRITGPLGPGSLQLFVDHDPEYHYFNFIEEDLERLRPVVLFDVVINNADRKGSHILKGVDGHLWLIDHGVCFHTEDKLRTVIWDFAGQPIPERLIRDLSKFRQEFRSLENQSKTIVEELQTYLSRNELTTMFGRIDGLITKGHFPNPVSYRRVVPYPQL